MTNASGVQQEATIVDLMLETEVESKSLRADVVHDKLKEIQSNSLRKLLERQNALIARVDELSKIPNMAERERQRAIIESDLQKVRTEYAKRQEDIGILANELFALYDELGMQSKVANEDTPEDIAKRTAAHKVVTTAEERLAFAKKALETAEFALKEVNEAFWPFGKKAKIADAENVVIRSKQNITNAEETIRSAQDNIAVVEEQIQVDKRERVRKASLSENFALIRDFTRNATDILKKDIEETSILAVATQKSLNSALTKKMSTARELEAVRDALQDLKRDLKRETDALGEIPDQSSVAYSDQQSVVAKLEMEMTDKSGQELKLNTTHMGMTQAIEADKSSLAGLKMQHDTSEVHLIKLTIAEKTAEILGRNIDRMIKNTTQETASDALDRVTDSMTFTAVRLGIQAEVASAKTRNDAIERHDELMKSLVIARKQGDEAVSVEAERYLRIDAMIREGYKNRGVDLDMSHLVEAAAMFEEAKEKTNVPVEESDIVY